MLNKSISFPTNVHMPNLNSLIVELVFNLASIHKEYLNVLKHTHLSKILKVEIWNRLPTNYLFSHDPSPFGLLLSFCSGM